MYFADARLLMEITFKYTQWRYSIYGDPNSEESMAVKTTVINKVSPFVAPQIGIHQGCLISALLFILVMEILAKSIKNNPH